MKQIIALVVVAFHTSLGIADESAQELVIKAVARSRAIKSGCFEMTHSRKDRELTFAHNFDPTRWRHKSGGSTDAEYGDTHMTLGGALLAILTKDPTARKLRFSGPQTLPIFAGSFWASNQAEWVEQHAADFVRVGNEQIDGIDTVVCDTYYKDPGPGPAVNFHPLLVSSRPDKELVRRIRLHIAPSLGHALPKYELYGASDKVLCRWTATEFKEAAPNIFIAGLIKQELAKEEELELNPETCHTGIYRVSASKINEKLNDGDLYFTIPAGSMVQDRQIEVFYKVKDDISSKDVVRLSDKASRLTAKELRRPIGLDE